MVMRTIVLALSLLLTLPPLLSAAQVSAVTDRDRLGAGESLRLELRVAGSTDGDPELAVLEQDWEILNRSQSSQMQLINGSFSRSLILTMNLMPRRSGVLQIPAICFGADCSLPQSVTVSDQSSVTTEAQPLLLEAEAQPQQLPVGAQLLLTVRLLHRVNLAQASLSEPRVEGGTAEIKQLGKDRNFEVKRDGYNYQAIERRYVIFPQQPGQLKIPALQLDAQIDAGSSRNDFFGRSLKQVRHTSQPLQIQVTEPPPGSGSRSWLPANRLTLLDDWQKQPPKLRVGEPATRTLTITAEGLPAAGIPELQLSIPGDWKSYPDQPGREDRENEQGIVGTLQQKLALVPTRPGMLELPSIDLDWYDLSVGQWRRAQLPALQLQVEPAAEGSLVTSPPLVSAPPTVERPPAAIPAEETTPSATTTTSWLWPLLALTLGLGWLVTLLLFWRHKRTATSTADTTSADNKKPDSEQAAFKAVLAAAHSNNPQAARQALLRWVRLSSPQATGKEFAALGRLGNTPLAEAVDELDRALYGGNAERWDGAALCSALSKLPRQQHQAPPVLPPLYPKN